MFLSWCKHILLQSGRCKRFQRLSATLGSMTSPSVRQPIFWTLHRSNLKFIYVFLCLSFSLYCSSESRPLRRGMSVCWCVRPLVCLSVCLSVTLSLNGQKQRQQATYAMFTALFVCLHTCLSVRCLYVGLSYLHATQVLWEGAISSQNSLKLSACWALHSINGQPCE